MFPKTIKKIGNQAFIDTGIKKLELPDSVIEIGRGAFERQMVSKRIKKIRLQKNFRNIGTAAFARNDFTSITIPQNVEFIGAWAFDECSELKTVYFDIFRMQRITE